MNQADKEVAVCRDDGRCQYAIDSGAEGLGHCPAGKCCMPRPTDGERWRFCLEHGFPTAREDGEWRMAVTCVVSVKRTRLYRRGAPNETVDEAMAAMKGKA